MIMAKDKNGKEYDYLDLSKMLYDTCEQEVLFDTAGWNIQDKKTQERMENFVKKFNENYDEYKFMSINLSFNPFHSLYYNSVLKEREGKHEVAQKLREAYTTRMANVINTMLPILEEHPKNFDIISRSFPDEKIKEVKGFQKDDLMYLYQEVVSKFGELYEERYKSVYTEKQLEEKFDNICKYFFNAWDGTRTKIGITGRLTKNFKYKNFRKTMDELYPDADNKIINKKMLASLIDLNGKVYFTDYLESYPTNIQLNYINKDKNTAPIRPVLHERIVEV